MIFILNSLNVFHYILIGSCIFLFLFILIPVDLEIDMPEISFVNFLFFNIKKIPVLLYTVLFLGIFASLGLLFSLHWVFLLIFTFLLSNIFLYPISKIRFDHSEAGSPIKNIEIIQTYENKEGNLYDVKITDWDNNLVFETLTEKELKNFKNKNINY